MAAYRTALFIFSLIVTSHAFRNVFLDVPTGQPDSFYSYTFTSLAPHAIYYIQSLPRWAVFDQTSRTVRGIPSPSDIGETWVQLDSPDGADSIKFLLVVSYGAVIRFDLPLKAQLHGDLPGVQISSVFPVSNASGVRVPFGWSFSIGFASNTCISASNSPVFYSVDNLNAIPAWVHFDNITLTFNGVSPKTPSITPINLTCAEDYKSPAVAFDTFFILVGDEPPSGSLQLVSPLRSIETTATNPVQWSLSNGLRESPLLKNGVPVSENLTAELDLGPTTWLRWDRLDQQLGGITPETFIQGLPTALIFPLTLTVQNATLATSLSILIRPYFFNAMSYPPIEVTPNSSFSVSIADRIQYSLTSTKFNINASIIPPDAAQWLAYDPSHLTISGTPALGLTYDHAVVVLSSYHSTTTSSTLSCTASFPVKINIPNSPAEDPLPSTLLTQNTGLSWISTVLLGILLPLICFILASSIILICRWRRRTLAPSKALDSSENSTLNHSQDMDGKITPGDENSLASPEKGIRLVSGSRTSLEGVPERIQPRSFLDTGEDETQSTLDESRGYERPRRFQIMKMLGGSRPRIPPTISLPLESFEKSNRFESQDTFFSPMSIPSFPIPPPAVTQSEPRPRLGFHRNRLFEGSASTPVIRTDHPLSRIEPMTTDQLATVIRPSRYSRSSWETRSHVSWSDPELASPVSKTSRRPTSIPRRRPDFRVPSFSPKVASLILSRAYSSKSDTKRQSRGSEEDEDLEDLKLNFSYHQATVIAGLRQAPVRHITKNGNRDSGFRNIESTYVSSDTGLPNMVQGSRPGSSELEETVANHLRSIWRSPSELPLKTPTSKHHRVSNLRYSASANFNTFSHSRTSSSVQIFKILEGSSKMNGNRGAIIVNADSGSDSEVEGSFKIAKSDQRQAKTLQTSDRRETMCVPNF